NSISSSRPLSQPVTSTPQKLKFTTITSRRAMTKENATTYEDISIVSFSPFQKNRLALEIMRLTFQMELLVAQAPDGMLYSLPPAELNTYTNMGQLKAELVTELYADRTVVVPSLLRAGFGQSVIEWLNNPTLTDTACRPIVSIVHNLSRHDNGADELN
ncbi:unnamed protein product, partial [Rotaria sordida]